MSTAAEPGRGKDGLWESRENHSAVFPPFPQTLEIDKADSHIFTAATTTGTNEYSQ
jgi:hypothetical protein